MSEFPTPESQLAIFEELSELCDCAYGHYDLWWFIRQAADILKKTDSDPHPDPRDRAMARFIEQLTSFAPIPSGTLARVTAKIMPGGYTMPGGAEIDVGLFTKITQGWKPPPPAKPVWMMATHATADSEPNVIGAHTLELYFTVLTKPYVPREFSQVLPLRETVLGLSPTKLMLRAMVDSALGLDPNDTRVESEAKRALRGFRDLDGIDFVAKIGEDGDGGNYLAQVITPGQPEWTQFHTAPITDAQRECMEAWNRVAACSVAV